MGVHPPDDRGVEADSAGENEVPAVAAPQVDPAGPEVVGQRDQVLRSVDDVIRDAGRPAHDLGQASGQYGNGNVGAGKPVGDLA